VDKKSREQFEMRTHKRLIDILEPDAGYGGRADGSWTCRQAWTWKSKAFGHAVKYGSRKFLVG